MINKKDLIASLLTMLFSLTAIIVYDTFFAKQKEMAVVDIKEITSEFMLLATKKNLSEDQVNILVDEYASSLEDGIAQLSTNYVVLAKRAVVSDELDLTGELRDYVAERITMRAKK